MGILASIFGRQDSPWNKVLLEEGIDEEFKSIIKKFFIADNISLEKFIQNKEAFETYESHGKYFANNLPQTPSLEFAANPMNRGRTIPFWFVIAYPDVIHWMTKNSPSVRSLYKPPYIENDQGTPVFFRALIQKFLHRGNTLECI